MSQTNTDKEDSKETTDKSLEFIQDVDLRIQLVMGQVELTIGEILKLKKGSVIELQKEQSEPLDIHANGNHVASGEPVVVNDHYGVRITRIEENE